jgi:hypothetical protein
MNLATHQRAMLHLFRSSYESLSYEDPHLLAISRSRDLQEARHNVFLWRAYVLAHTAPLTFNLLKRLGQLKPEIDSYIASHDLSPFRETHAPIFLDRMSKHADPLIASVAQFEQALHRAQKGETVVYVFRWKMNPLPLLMNLARDEPINIDDQNETIYEITVAKDILGCFKVLQVGAPPATQRGGTSLPGS